jgi:hypothetical protein
MTGILGGFGYSERRFALCGDVVEPPAWPLFLLGNRGVFQSALDQSSPL